VVSLEAVHSCVIVMSVPCGAGSGVMLIAFGGQMSACQGARQVRTMSPRDLPVALPQSFQAMVPLRMVLLFQTALAEAMERSASVQKDFILPVYERK
jgi:hypothetical protein